MTVSGEPVAEKGGSSPGPSWLHRGYTSTDFNSLAPYSPTVDDCAGNPVKVALPIPFCQVDTSLTLCLALRNDELGPVPGTIFHLDFFSPFEHLLHILQHTRSHILNLRPHALPAMNQTVTVSAWGKVRVQLSYFKCTTPCNYS